MQPYLSPDAASLADLLPAFLPLGLPLGLQLGVGLSLPLFSLPFALGCGDLVGGDPVKIRVSTYCESGPASGIFTGDMRTIAYERVLRVSVPCGLCFAFPCNSRGKVDPSALAPEALANWQWVLSHGHDWAIETTLHTFPVYTAD